MKRIICLVLCITLCLYMTSCVDINVECDKCEDEYLTGLSNGHTYVFAELYNSIPNKTTLYSDKLWEEKNFSFIISHTENDSEIIISTKLRVPGITIYEAFEKPNVYIGIYGLENGATPADRFSWMAWSEICEDFDSYTLCSILQDTDEHVFDCSFSTYDDINSVSVVISIDGNIYAADYYL